MGQGFCNGYKLENVSVANGQANKIKQNRKAQNKNQSKQMSQMTNASVKLVDTTLVELTLSFTRTKTVRLKS